MGGYGYVLGQAPSNLLHPGFIGMWRDPSDLNAMALKVDKEQHIIRDQPAQRQYFHREKSVPARTAMCARMKSVHVVVRFLAGAGGMPWRCKILPTV